MPYGVYDIAVNTGWVASVTPRQAGSASPPMPAAATAPGLPRELRRSLACTNIIENALGTVRQVTRNVKR